LRKQVSFLAAALIAAPALGQMTPSSSAQIAEAAVDCWSVVSASPVDQDALQGKGWVKGSVKTAEGAPLPTGFDLYGKPGTGALVMISRKIDPHGCMVVSQAANADDVSAAIPLILAGIRATDPAAEVKKVSAQEVGFFALPKAALFALTGNPTKPGVRIQVSYTAPEKK